MPSRKYKDFIDAAELSAKAERAAVSGYHRIKIPDELKDKQNSSIINAQRNKDMSILPDEKTDIPIEKFMKYAPNPEKDFNKAMV